MVRPKTDYEKERDGDMEIDLGNAKLGNLEVGPSTRLEGEKKCGFQPKLSEEENIRLSKESLDQQFKFSPRKFTEGSIDGLLKINLQWNVDSRGMLIEVLRANDEHYQNATDAANPHEGNFGQNYVVVDPMPYTIRAFHAHNCLWDFFTIINGSAKFVFYDDRDGSRDKPRSDTYGNMEVVVTGRMNPMCIVVRPEVLHGWMSLEPNTILLSTGTHVYQEVCKTHGAPDEMRLPWDTFGKDVWEVEKK